MNEWNENEQKFPKPGPVAAIVVMLLELGISFYVLSAAQYYLGMWGMVITELAFVVISLGAAWVVGLNIKEMLPFKRIRVNEFFGTIVIWAGALLLVLIVNLIFFYFFPEGLEVNVNINAFINSWPVIPALFVVAVMPAVCEEMLHRGFIQRCFMKKIKSKMLICIIMGLLFGLFHMDFYRFIGTAILGGILSYILITTDNFFYNMLFHFVNNFFSQMLSIIAGNMTDTIDTAEALTRDTIPFALASYLIIGCVTPFLLLGGSMLLKGLKRIKAEGTVKLVVSVIIAGAVTAVMFVAGVIMFVSLEINAPA
ncbi:MAG: CPBP family intramembrane metalloprotease [Lachnospiraceae bacterium]|nr:CPBP family intramembrane metalloprotease [Lachnospiraceae bacterium]